MFRLNADAMLNDPLLSICIPTYCRKDKLIQTLNSLLPQCLGKDVEVVISDNASNDGTAEYCLRQASSSAFLRYSCQDNNIGFSNNLISVLSKASGKYLWMLGDDEVLHPKALERILSAIKATDPSWLVCNFVKLEFPNDKWPLCGQITYDGGLYPLTLDEILGAAGAWSSFMSISVIRRDAFCTWLKCNRKAASDYVGFDIALFSGQNGKCYILDSPVIARIKEPLANHRFDKLSVYLFDFFDPIDALIKRGVLTSRVRFHLANEMFFSMAGFLLLRAKVKGDTLPVISDCVRYHARNPMFWLIIFPILILPSWFVKRGLHLLAWFVQDKSNSKLSRLITSLGDIS